MDELMVLVKSNNPDIIAITESWLSDDILEDEIKLSKYDILRMDRKSDTKLRGGGVLVYIHHSLRSVVLDSERVDNLEFLWMKVYDKGCEEIRLGVCYRPPNGNEAQIKGLIKNISKFDSIRTIVIGDFNFSDINWKSYTSGKVGKVFLKAVKKLGTHQMVKTKTRGENILDLVLLYEKSFVFKMEHLAPIGNSDHETRSIVLNAKIDKTKLILERFNYNKANYEVLKKEVEKVDWELETKKSSVNELWNRLINILKDFKEKFIPRFKNAENDEVPWSNNSIKKMIKKRNNVYKRFSKSGHIYFKLRYRKLRNKVTKQIKLAKIKYEGKIIKRSKNNRKIFYTYVNCTKKGKGGKKIGPLLKNKGIIGEEELVDDDREIVVELNDYFCTVFSNELVRDNNDDIMLLDKENQVENMDSISFTDEDVIKAISEFKENKSAGIDEINSTYAINIKEIVAKPLRILFNKSLQENEIPDEWKTANITPIFKKGDKSLVSNYRPVSLTVLFCKVMENLIKQNIDRHLF